jgi:hypothetical protein
MCSEMFVQFCSCTCTWYKSHVPVTVYLIGEKHTGDVTATGYSFVSECLWAQRYIDIQAVTSLSSVSMFAIDLVDIVLRLWRSSVIKRTFHSFPAEFFFKVLCECVSVREVLDSDVKTFEAHDVLRSWCCIE